LQSVYWLLMVGIGCLWCGNIAFQHPIPRSHFLELGVFSNSQYNIRLQFCGVCGIQGSAVGVENIM
jgi:hypothetical protein